MQCDCVQEIEKKVSDRLAENNPFPKPVEDVHFPLAINFVTGRGVTYTSVQVRLDGQKKLKDYMVVHTYCPFCGEKQRPYGADEDGNKS